MANRTDREAKFIGGMVGSALGDAIGELAFYRPTKAGLLSEVDQDSSSSAQPCRSFSSSASRARFAERFGFSALSAESSSAANSLTSAQIGRSTFCVRPNTLASTSTWMIFAPGGQYSMSYCGRVPKGPSRVPRASTTSALEIVRIAEDLGVTLEALGGPPTTQPTEAVLTLDNRTDRRRRLKAVVTVALDGRKPQRFETPFEIRPGATEQQVVQPFDLRSAGEANDRGKVCIVGRNPKALWFDDYADRVIYDEAGLFDYSRVEYARQRVAATVDA